MCALEDRLIRGHFGLATSTWGAPVSGHVPKVNTTTKCLGKSFAASTDIAVEKDRVKLQNQKLEQYLGINPKGEKDPTYDRSHLFGDDFTVSGYGGHIPRHRLGQI